LNHQRHGINKGIDKDKDDTNGNQCGQQIYNSAESMQMQISKKQVLICQITFCGCNNSNSSTNES
jgi:hypothetical protein